ncbi:MAG: class I SAM-dependent methyltransferase [Bacteroidota bacterium]
MTVKEHYDHHLGDLYSWMSGDFETRKQEFRDFLETNGIHPGSSKIALDLGCGHGIQSVALAGTGYEVIAVDFNRQLLDELALNSSGLPVKIVDGDILDLSAYAKDKPELILCWGDTLTHLQDTGTIRQFLSDCSSILVPGGSLLLSFRDYSTPLSGDSRFIPVKSDESRILTCCLDYGKTHVMVTDILHFHTNEGWRQKVSSYYKVRIAPNEIIRILEQNDLSIIFRDIMFGMTRLIARK